MPLYFMLITAERKLKTTHFPPITHWKWRCGEWSEHRRLLIFLQLKFLPFSKVLRCESETQRSTQCAFYVYETYQLCKMFSKICFFYTNTGFILRRKQLKHFTYERRQSLVNKNWSTLPFMTSQHLLTSA